MIYLSTNHRRHVSSCNINYSPDGIYHPDRMLNEYDLLYMINGNWNIIEDNIPYQVNDGDLLILEPHKHHYSTEKCSSQMRNMYIHFPILPGDGIPVPDALRLKKITNCKDQIQIENLFQQIIETYWSKHSNKQFRLCALMDLLLSELALPEEDNSPWIDPIIKDILHLFYFNPERFYSPQELADSYCISVRTLSTRFKKATGSSIHQYQLKYKLNSAHEQLPLYPDRGLRDIALSFGFYDEFHFSRLFKRQFGYPPSKLQK